MKTPPRQHLIFKNSSGHELSDHTPHAFMVVQMGADFPLLPPDLSGGVFLFPPFAAVRGPE